MRDWSILLLGFVVVACKKPPQAPAKLDQLSAYLYTHQADDDDAELVAGLDNLATWLDNHLDETEAGYTVDNLDQDTVDALYDKDQDLSGLVGAAVGNDSDYSPEEIVDAVTLEDPMAVFPDTYSEYERTWVEPEADVTPTCFGTHDCTWAVADNHAVADYELGLQAESWNECQFRWVELDSGWAMIHRSWLTAPAVLNYDWIELDSQFFLTVTLPRDGGHSRRLQAAWMVAKLVDASVPEATALNMVIKSMQGTATDIDTWLGEQQ